jgi:RNA-binding protein YlmH
MNKYIDKKSFINGFDCEDKNLLASIYDKIMLCEKTGNLCYTNEFLPPNIWHKLYNMRNKFFINMDFSGVFQECERKMVAFYKYDTPKNYPMYLMKITNKSKFRTLGHRDYLGSLMSLGIKREKFGDLVIENNICYGAVGIDICEYIKYNLEMIADCPCSVEFIEEYDHIVPKRAFSEKVIIINSLRVDSILSEICNLSRANAVKLVNSGRILVNYDLCVAKDKEIKTNDIITVRGIGKYKMGSVLGVTQKKRIKINVLKYT